MGCDKIGSDEFDFVKKITVAVWEKIAACFKDSDEHLIFESMNEVTGSGTTAKEDTEKIMELNQIFVAVVRATGSNNEERWLSVPGRYTNIGHSTDPNVGFELPKDGTKNRLFVAVHYYDWQFGLLENKNQTTFSYDTAKNLAYAFAKL